MLRRQFLNASIVLVVFCGLMVAGCGKKEDAAAEKPRAKAPSAPKKAQLLVELPDYCNTPDGMALLPDGSFVLSVPNYNDPNAGAFIMKISADNKVSKFFTPPLHPKTKVAAPMGICLAPSGDLYYADNQFFQAPQSSRVMRIAMRDGQPQEAVTAVSGMNVANAVAIKGDYVYVSDIVEEMVRAAGVGGVYNIASGTEAPVMEVFEQVCAAAGKESEPILADLREGELQRSRMDPTRAAEKLGWKAEIPLEEGIKRTYEALVAGFEGEKG